MTLPTVHILFENPAWNPPLTDALDAAGFPYELHYLDDGIIDPSVPPAEGIWINRISPSSHTREHGSTVAMAREWLFWLGVHGREVINGSHAFELEMSKLRQELVLRKYGVRTPRTVLATGKDNLLRLARTFEGPFITKHNQGGKGLGIMLFNDADVFADYIDSPDFDWGPDGKIILQQYIQPPEPFITRVELVGDRFLFAMRSRTDDGFQLCPSDACQVPATNPAVCPIDGEADEMAANDSKFSLAPIAADDPLVQQLLALVRGEDLQIAGIEFVEDANGNRYVYDINGTTNYSGVLGRQIDVDGMTEVVRYLREVIVPRMSRRVAA
ncbi:MAG: alpha-L-glutamate ligase [Deltaproteobacteria bacterium]|nr:alpha-L-glutamate ligase [Deltaproteobacteria bacterium]